VRVSLLLLAVAAVVIAVAIANDGDASDTAQTLMLFVLPPRAGVAAGAAAWLSFSTTVPARYLAAGR
jgi:hypothetical protein